MLGLLFFIFVAYESGLIYTAFKIENTVPDTCSWGEVAALTTGIVLWPLFRLAGLFQPVTQHLLPDIGETV